MNLGDILRSVLSFLDEKCILWLGKKVYIHRLRPEAIHDLRKGVYLATPSPDSWENTGTALRAFYVKSKDDLGLDLPSFMEICKDEMEFELPYKYLVKILGKPVAAKDMIIDCDWNTWIVSSCHIKDGMFLRRSRLVLVAYRYQESLSAKATKNPVEH